MEYRRTLVRAASRGVTAVVLVDGTTPVATDGETPDLEVVAVPLLEV